MWATDGITDGQRMGSGWDNRWVNGWDNRWDNGLAADGKAIAKNNSTFFDDYIAE